MLPYTTCKNIIIMCVAEFVTVWVYAPTYNRKHRYSEYIDISICCIQCCELHLVTFIVMFWSKTQPSRSRQCTPSHRNMFVILVTSLIWQTLSDVF